MDCKNGESMNQEFRLQLESEGIKILELEYDPILKTNTFVQYNEHTFAYYDSVHEIPLDLPDATDISCPPDDFTNCVDELGRPVTIGMEDYWWHSELGPAYDLGEQNLIICWTSIIIAIAVTSIVMGTVYLVLSNGQAGPSGVQPPCGEMTTVVELGPDIKHLVHPDCSWETVNIATGEVLNKGDAPQQVIPYEWIVGGGVAIMILYVLSKGKPDLSGVSFGRTVSEVPVSAPKSVVAS